VGHQTAATEADRLDTGAGGLTIGSALSALSADIQNIEFGVQILLGGSIGMRAPASAPGFDSERTCPDPSGPATLRETGPARLGRGSVLAGKYRLEMLLGEGGMGFVWSAYNVELEAPVAVKLLRASPNSKRLAERLRFEARATARLVHPSIVRVLDVATTDGGEPFIVMELLTGETLSDALLRGPMSGERAVQLLLPIAEALALAHAHGIVHRDLKPDNVFLSTDGERLQPKLLDFGIAKLGFGQSPLTKLTEDGTVLGSPLYMSPEQVSGEGVDQRGDIWSFCVVLYKALTGRAPFGGADRRAVMDAILTELPAPIPEAAHVHPELARLVHWGMCKDRTRRPSSIQELARELARWLLSQGITEDACGAPLVGKWLPHATSTSPSANARAATAAALAHAAPLASHATSPTLAVRMTRSEAARPRRTHKSALLTALAMLLVSGSLAWTDSARPASEPRDGTAPEARLPRLAPTPRFAAAPEPPREEPPIAADTEQNEAAAPASVEPPPAPRSAPRPRNKPKSPGSRNNRVPASRLPF
jgi:eukaryotic-like serine/threonine-protein kinase